MVHLSLSQTFLVLVPKPAVSLQPASPLSPPLSPPPQHLVGLQPAIILALRLVARGRYDNAAPTKQRAGVALCFDRLHHQAINYGSIGFEF